MPAHEAKGERAQALRQGHGLHTQAPAAGHGLQIGLRAAMQHQAGTGIGNGCLGPPLLARRAPTALPCAGWQRSAEEITETPHGLRRIHLAGLGQEINGIAAVARGVVLPLAAPFVDGKGGAAVWAKGAAAARPWLPWQAQVLPQFRNEELLLEHGQVVGGIRVHR